MDYVSMKQFMQIRNPVVNLIEEKLRGETLRACSYLEEHLMRGKMPGNRAGASLLIRDGVTQFVCLDLYVMNEAWFDKKGVEFAQIPISLEKFPSNATIQEFLDLIEPNRKVFFYCTDGVSQTSILAAIYVYLTQGEVAALTEFNQFKKVAEPLPEAIKQLDPTAFRLPRKET